MSDRKHLTGLIAAVFTPMYADGRLDLERIDLLAGALANNGLSGAFVCGTTGECLSLTVGERMEVAQRWLAVAGEELAVIVHVGHNCLAECKALAAHARQIGAAAIAAFGPCYFRPKSAEDLAAFCAEVAAAAGELPFYYYHIPGMSGVELPVHDFLQAAKGQIPNLAGVKYTHEDLMDFGRCLRLDGGRFDMLFGRDEFVLAALALGARGAVGTTYSFAAPLYAVIFEAFEAGQMAAAAERQARAMELVTVFGRFGGLPAGKAIMKMINLDCGPVRLPLRNLTDQQYRKLRSRLEQIGFFEYCLKA